MSQNFAISFLLFGLTVALINCDSKKSDKHETAYTKIDSLTEIYLDLQDSMLITWNLMINDDNKKLKAMLNLLHELKYSGGVNAEQLNSLQERLDQLPRIRYTSKTISNADIIEEYDFASNSVVSELLSIAEGHPTFSYNKILQNFVNQIRNSEQRVENYRGEYDAVVTSYNQFIEKNKAYMKEIDSNCSLDKRPLFQVVSDTSK